MQETIGQRLRSWRIEQGWSQADLAAKTGKSQGAVSKWERDVDAPDTDARVKLNHLSLGAFGLLDWDAPRIAAAS